MVGTENKRRAGTVFTFQRLYELWSDMTNAPDLVPTPNLSPHSIIPLCDNVFF